MKRFFYSPNDAEGVDGLSIEVDAQELPTA